MRMRARAPPRPRRVRAAPPASAAEPKWLMVAEGDGVDVVGADQAARARRLTVVIGRVDGRLSRSSLSSSVEHHGSGSQRFSALSEGGPGITTWNIVVPPLGRADTTYASARATARPPRGCHARETTGTTSERRRRAAPMQHPLLDGRASSHSISWSTGQNWARPNCRDR